MKNRQIIIMIFILLGFILVSPKNVEADNSVPAFKCFYQTKVTEANKSKTYTLKLLYVNGELKAAINKDESKGGSKDGAEIESNSWDLKNFKYSANKIGLWNQIVNIGSSCPESFTTTNGYLVNFKNVSDMKDNIESYTLSYENNSKQQKYTLTKSGTQKIGSGTVSDKECSYTNDSAQPSTIDVHFYRTKYISSMIKGNGKKLDGFWISKDWFYADSNYYNSNSKGFYTSIHDYITKYSSKPNTCPEKVLYNADSNKVYAGTISIKNQQANATKNQLLGDDSKYVVYKFDKNKICRDKLSENSQKTQAIEGSVNSLEQSIKNAGTNITAATNNVYQGQLDEIANNLKNLDAAIENCNKVSGYSEIKKRIEEITKKLENIKKEWKNNIRNSSMSEDEKSAALKNVDKSFSKMSKLDIMGISMYNKKQDCESILGDPAQKDTVAYMLQTVLNYIKIIAPIIVIVLSSLDFIKAIWSSEDDNMKKAQTKLIKRLVAALLLFLLPSLIAIILDLVNVTGNPTCGIK